MLHARVNSGISSWIVSLVSGAEEICILRVCLSESEAQKYAISINSKVLPRQKAIIDKLNDTQTFLRDILEKIGPVPATSDELILAVRKAIRCIERGKLVDTN